MGKAIIVGTGNAGSWWCKTLAANKDVEVVACVDKDLDSATKAAEENGFHALVTDDYEKAIGEAPADFLVDVTPPSLHCDLTVKALQAGLHVLGEKPMAMSMAEARKMIAASEQAGRLYMVSQSRRYDKRIIAYREGVRQLKDLGILKSDFFMGAHFGGFRLEMSSPLLLDMGIHTFDAARFVTERDAVSVYCELYNPTWSWMKSGSSADALFEMEGGLRYTYCGSWAADGKPTSWEAEWRAHGANGSARWDGYDGLFLDLVDEEFKATTTDLVPPTDFVDGITGALQEFLCALDTGVKPNGECHDNLKSLAMVFAAEESSRLGRRVKLSEI